MGIDKDKSLSAAAELRRRATEQLATQAAAVGISRTEYETCRLLHELQVHQIELEMQNEELLQTRVGLETALEKYTDLYDFAPVSYLVLGRDGSIRAANLTAATFLKVERTRLLGQRFGMFVAVTDRLAFAAFLEKIITTPAKKSCEVTLDREGDFPCFMQIEGVATASGEECRIALLDVTERKRVDEALRESQQGKEFLTRVVQHAAQPFGQGFPDGRLGLVNKAFELLTGYSEDELKSMNWAQHLTPPEWREAEKQQLEELLRTGIPIRYEKEYIRKDGARVPVELLVHLVTGPADEPLCYYSFITDITERKRAEEALRRSEALYRGIGESIDYGVWVCAPDGRNTYASESFLKMVGITQEQCSNFGWGNVLHPDDAERTIAAWRECVRTGGKWDIEHRFRGVDGQWHHVLARGVPVKNEQGEIICWAGINLEINRLKQAEVALRASEERHRAILKTAIDGFWLTDRQGRLLEVNEAYCQMSGYSVQELLGMSISDLEANETPGDTAAHIRKAMEQGADRFESRHRRKDGSIFDVEASVQYLPANGECFVGFLRDITERKRMAKLASHLASFPQMNPNPVLEVDYSGRITFFNPATVKILETFEMGEEDIAVFLPSDMDDILASWESLDETTRYREVVVKGRTFGETIFLTPKLNVARIYTHDITAPKKEEEERETTVEFLRLVNERLGTDDLIKNAATFFQEKSGCEAFGIRLKEGDDYPYYEARGFPHEFVMAENSLCAKDAAGDIIRDHSGNPVLACMCGKIVCGRFDPIKNFFSKGGSFWTNSTTKLLASTTETDLKTRARNRCHGEGYESVALIPLCVGAERLGLIQLNDRRPGMFTAENIALWERLAGYLSIAIMKFRAEDDVLKLNKDLAARNVELEAAKREIEAFSYSVSHDLRAPLRAIDGFSKILLERYHNLLDEKGGDYLRRVRNATQKMAQLIDDLLKLSRLTRGDMHITFVDLSFFARGVAAELTKSQAARQITFAITEGLVAQCDQHLIKVVLDNLLGNAWKFTGKKEQAVIEFGSTLIDGTQTYFVRDNGAGFDMAYADKLFGTFQRLHLERDFPGTGIGLSLVQRIIHRHGGKVWAEGVVNKGATFYFTLTPMMRN